MCFACDKWDQVHDNIYAVGNTIEALHGIERWGTDDTVEQAFTGFAALPSPKVPHALLGIIPRRDARGNRRRISLEGPARASRGERMSMAV
jgi:hypothetical protein